MQPQQLTQMFPHNQSALYDNAQMYQAQPMVKTQPSSFNSQYDNFLANQGYGQNTLPQYQQQQANHAQMSQIFPNQQHYSYKQNSNQQNVRNQPIKYRDK